MTTYRIIKLSANEKFIVQRRRWFSWERGKGCYNTYYDAERAMEEWHKETHPPKDELIATHYL